MRRRILLTVCLAASLLLFAGPSVAGELLIGAASVDITPPKPTALCGQLHTRIAHKVRSPLSATAVAIEARDGEEVIDQAVMVSIDTVAIRLNTQDLLRGRLESRLPGFDLRKLFINATHTHTAPTLVPGRFIIPDRGVMTAAEYRDFMLDRIAGAVAKAWENREPGGVGWGMGHAVVGANRLVAYRGGGAKMYGDTSRPDFSHLQGYEDHAVEVLFFWDKEERLTAVAVNLACPAQTTGGISEVSSDFWHDVRLKLRERYGDDLAVLGQVSAAGDQSPRVLYRKAAEERMRRLRGLSETQEIARRICRAVDDAYEMAKTDVRVDVSLSHHVESLRLPLRLVTEEEIGEARRQLEELRAEFAELPRQSRRAGVVHRQIGRYETVVERYERQQTEPWLDMELHVIRLGDCAIATNSFELFLDYGVQIKARSKALHTFLVQLACAADIYLPTERALEGGGYGAGVTVSRVGPEGGRKLVDRTVETINAKWEDSK
jgi:hypothetical protein